MRGGGWLNNYIAVVTVFAFITCFWKVRNELEDDIYFRIGRKKIIVLFISAIIIVWIAGIGGFSPQMYDNIIRTPMLRDLLLEDWPVVYQETNAALTYYFIFWLFPALVGKMLLFLGVNLDIVWNITNIVLLLWSAVYLLLIFLITIGVCMNGREIKFKCMFKLLFCFLSFGGISVIGYEITKILGLYSDTLVLDGLLIEHYSYIGVLNNFFLMLGNVFNQFLPGMLCATIFYAQRNLKISGYFLALILLAAPYPAVGIFVIMVLWFGTQIILNRKVPFRLIFSIYNLCAICWACFAMLFFYGNSMAGVNLNDFWNCYDHLWEMVCGILIYHVCMWFCYYIFIYKSSKDKRLLKIVAFCFLLLPFGKNDFNMRASIASQYILFLEVFRCLVSREKKFTYLLALLSVAAVSPIIVMGSMLSSIRLNGTFFLPMNNYYTLSNLQEEELDIIVQYVKYAPESDFFFEHISKETKRDKAYPVIEYNISENGERYIHRVSVFSVDAIQLLMNDVDTGSQKAVTEYLRDYPQKKTFLFPLNEIRTSEKKFLDTELAEVQIDWNNSMTKIHKDEVQWIMDFTVKNIGRQDILVGSENDSCQTGLVVTLYDIEKKPICDLGFEYTNKTILIGDSKRVVLKVNKPEKGIYYIKVDYFCEDLSKLEGFRGYEKSNRYYMIEVK